MAVDYTITEIINDIKQRASIPSVQNLYQDAQFARFVGNKVRSNIVPAVMSTQEDHFVYSHDIAITTATKATNRYRIPYRATGSKLKTLVVVDTDGQEEEVPRITYKDRSLPAFTDFQRLHGFYFIGDAVALYPSNAWTGRTLRMYYYRRPNMVVPTSQAGKITNIAGSVVSLDTDVTSWTITDTFDVIAGYPEFRSIQDDVTITLKSGADLTFSSVPTDMAVGDYVALSGESPIPQVPYDTFPLVAQLGTIKVLEGLGDKSGVQTAILDYQKLYEDIFKMLSPRADEQPKKLVSRKSLLRTGGARNWRR